MLYVTSELSSDIKVMKSLQKLHKVGDIFQWHCDNRGLHTTGYHLVAGVLIMVSGIHLFLETFDFVMSPQSHQEKTLPTFGNRLSASGSRNVSDELETSLFPLYICISMDLYILPYMKNSRSLLDPVSQMTTFLHHHYTRFICLSMLQYNLMFITELVVKSHCFPRFRGFSSEKLWRKEDFFVYFVVCFLSFIS